MVSIAERNRTRKKLANVSFKVADATKLPFPDGYFDYVSICCGLHDKEKSIRDIIISEMKRVVKREGALVLIDFYVLLPKSIRAMFAEMIEFLIGGPHYRAFNDCRKNGGLEELLKIHGLQRDSRAFLMGGLLVIVKARSI